MPLIFHYSEIKKNWQYKEISFLQDSIVTYLKISNKIEKFNFFVVIISNIAQ